MEIYILEAKEDRELGELGYLFKDTPIISAPMVSNDGLLLAHDLIEHVNGLHKIGSIDDEIEALGSSYYIRGQTGQLRRDDFGSRYSPEENYASDILNLFMYYNDGVDFKTPIPKTRACIFDEAFKEILNIGKHQIKQELENEDIDRGRLETFLHASLHYLRKGYRKAKKRFPNAYKINNLFFALADELTKWVKSPKYEGHQIELKIDFNSCRFRIDEFYPEDFY